MRRILLAAAMVAALLAVPVSVPAAPVPFAQVDNTQVMYDVYGQRIDAHDGDLLQTADGTIYLYGTAYGCGFKLNTPATAYCGVRVYTTRDLRVFTPAGAVGGQYAFDHLGAFWQGLCAPSPTAFGCYRPHVVQRPSDGKYVMWINAHGPTGYVTLVADSPAGPFVPTGVAPVLAVDPVTGLRWGDQDITVAPDGRGYITYTVIEPSNNAHTLVIEELDAAMLTGAGRYVVTDAFPGQPDLVEAPGLFYGPNNAWYLTYSNPAMPYRWTGTGVMNGPRNTSDPIGAYVSPRSLTDTSCMGQPTGVWPIRGASGVTSYVFGSDRWETGNPNQSKANNYYGALTFYAQIAEGRAIDAYSCQAYWTLGG